MTPEEFEEACKLMKLYDLYVPDITDIPSGETPATIVDKIEADGFPSLWDEEEPPRPYITLLAAPSLQQDTALPDHLKYCRLPGFRCEECDIPFDTYERLAVHRFAHKRTCGICGVLFRDQTRLKDHIVSCTPGAYTFDCDLCKLRFSCRSGLVSHRASHAKTCVRCGKHFQKQIHHDAHVKVCGTAGKRAVNTMTSVLEFYPPG